MQKKYAVDSSQIKRLVPDLGSCFATDKVTVSGSKVGYMVKDAPSREGDSGWVFMAGTETQEYLDDPDNTSIYAVNTIANYDRDIIPFLLYPPGTEVERNPAGRFVVLQGPSEPPDVRLLYPAFPGSLQISKTWSFEVSMHLLRRLDEGSMVMWRPGFTIWMNLYSESGFRSPEDRLTSLSQNAAPSRYDEETAKDEHQIRYRYRLDEPQEDGSIQSAAYCFGFTDHEELHLSIYFDTDESLREVDLIWSTISCSQTPIQS